MEHEPDQWDAQMERGMALLASGDWKGAAMAFARVRTGAPRHLTRTIATNNLAWTNLMMGTPFAVKEALILAREAMDGIDVETPRRDHVESVKTTLAFALTKNGDNARGLELIDEVLAGETRESRQLALRMCVRAIALARAGDASAARSVIRRASQADPRCQLLAEAIESVGGRTVAAPPGLQVLAPLLDKFGISDDVERGRVVNEATTAELRDLVGIVTPEVLEQINRFLEETFDAEYAVRFGDLAQAAIEAELELKEREIAAEHG
jgi:hypothetical protein